MRRLILTAIFALSAACEPAPEPIAFGHDECAYCRMIVSEPAFGSRLLTRKGRTYAFDSIECMAAFEHRGDVAHVGVHSRLVPDFDDPGLSLRVEDAHIRHLPELRSPMGLSLSAHVAPPVDGRVLTWDEVMRFVAGEWGLQP